MAWDDAVKHLPPGTIVWHEDADRTVSHHQETANAVQKAAKKLARDASFTLAAHRLEGHARITMTHSPPTHLDSYVWLESPAESSSVFAAALSIERGHWVFNKDTMQAVRTKGTDRKGRASGVAPLETAIKKSVRERRMSVK